MNKKLDFFALPENLREAVITALKEDFYGKDDLALHFDLALTAVGVRVNGIYNRPRAIEAALNNGIAFNLSAFRRGPFWRKSSDRVIDLAGKYPVSCGTSRVRDEDEEGRLIDRAFFAWFQDLVDECEFKLLHTPELINEALTCVV